MASYYNQNPYGMPPPQFGGQNPYGPQGGQTTTPVIGYEPGKGTPSHGNYDWQPKNPNPTPIYGPEQTNPYWTPGMQATQRDFGEKASAGYISAYGILDQARFENYGAAQQEEALRRANIGQLGQGFDRARSELDRFGEAGYRRARESGEALQGAAKNQLISSGLYGTSEAVQVERGVAADTERRMMDVDSMLAKLYSGHETQRAQAMYQATDSLAGFYNQQARIDENLFLEEFNARLGRGVPSSGGGGKGGNSDAGMWQALGSAAGLFLATLI